MSISSVIPTFYYISNSKYYNWLFVGQGLLEEESGIEAVKHRGLTVLRAKVTKKSSLIGKTASQSDFRGRFRAGIIAWKKAENDTQVRNFSEAVFSEGDVLILQVSDESPLLQAPPADPSKSTSFIGSIFSSVSQDNAPKEREDALLEVSPLTLLHSNSF